MRSEIPSPGPAIEMEYSKTPKGRVKIKPKGAEIPSSPGVYFIVLKDDPDRVFYVGEARDIARRVKFTFRCPEKDPSPCCKDYALAYKTPPTYEDFCKKFCVRYLETKGMRGRIEIEEELQKKHGTNKADFYINWEP